MKTMFAVARDEGDGYHNAHYLAATKELADELCRIENEGDRFKAYSVQELTVYESVEEFQRREK